LGGQVWRVMCEASRGRDSGSVKVYNSIVGECMATFPEKEVWR
jgi:hypothetical protein